MSAVQALPVVLMAKANVKMDSHDSQQSLHLHFESDSENINSTDLNDTLEYEDYSLIDTGASATYPKVKEIDTILKIQIQM